VPLANEKQHNAHFDCLQSARYSTKEQLARHDRDKILRQHMGEAAVPQVGRMRLRSATALYIARTNALSIPPDEDLQW